MTKENETPPVEKRGFAVYAAITSVMKEMSEEGISKDRKNSQQGYSFRGIDDIYNALGKVLAKHNLSMLPRVTKQERESRKTKSGGDLTYTILSVDFDLVSSLDGSMHTISTVGEAMDSADKSSNKAMSAAYKYAALMSFAIPTEGDNDADSTTHDLAPRQQRNDPPPAQQQNGMPQKALNDLMAALGSARHTEDYIIQKYRVKNVRDLSQEQYADAMQALSVRAAGLAKEGME